MAAFERVLSGISQMDAALDNIRLGDNVVWQVDNLDQFKLFMEPYVKQALADGRDLIYVRFSKDRSLLDEQKGLKIWHIPLSHRFETFTAEIWRRVTKEGFDAFYVFDCLSLLQTAWATDLMMGNFFRVTCPQLFKLDTVAYFPLIRGRHSDAAIAKIRDTTQLFLDVYADDQPLVQSKVKDNSYAGISEGQSFRKAVYVHPLKVWNRSSNTMFLPHRYDPETGEYCALTDGIEIGRYYKMLAGLSIDEQGADDYWDRFFRTAKRVASRGKLYDDSLKMMCNIMMTRDERLRPLVQRYFRADDYFSVRDRMIGTGMIGGKACGMLLARRIVSEELPQYHSEIEPQDSYFIGSDVFYTFLIENDCWRIRLEQRTEEGYFAAAPKLMEAIRKGHFPEDIRERFRRMLDYFGASPIIVRSSSILEDGFGNAFAGKYESVFCVNAGTAEVRLEEFEAAVRRVYESTMDLSALEYRRKHNLDKRDEQMSLLVQRVSGSYFGKYFFPCAAGVGYSYSSWRFLPDMDPSAGMLRIVIGLGTRAVDRRGNDYPRMISLDRPEAFVNGNMADRHRYSQRHLDVLDIISNRMEEVSLEDVSLCLPENVKKAVLSHDSEAESFLRERGQRGSVLFATCQGLARNKRFIQMMKDILRTLQTVYGVPVDIEYTVNVGREGTFAVNLLQCRPLMAGDSSGAVQVPRDASDSRSVFHIRRSGMGESKSVDVQAIVYVEPMRYYSLEYARKTEAARAVGLINRFFQEKGLCAVLIAPGRIGTSSPELGIPVTFAQIDHFTLLVETECSESHVRPELSFGSHMFQDLVEAGITYGAIYENSHTLAWNPALLLETTNLFEEICPDMSNLQNMIHVSIYAENSMHLYYDSASEDMLLIQQSHS